jgi:hypothetical protein
MSYLIGTRLYVNGINISTDGNGDVYPTCTTVGNGALLSNTGDNSNNAFGYQALYSNTTGYSNNAVGIQACYRNTTGSFNNVVGYQALYSNNTTGNSNNAVGHQALYNNTTGSSNNAFGYQALYNNVSEASCCAIGYNALYQRTYGSSNTAIGFQAGNVAGTSGTPLSNNTFLGANTTMINGYYYSNSTAVGYGATITGNNQIALGRSSETVYVSGVFSASGSITVGPNATTPVITLNASTGAITAGTITAGTINSMYIGLGGSAVFTNTSVGFQALNANPSTAISNTAIGYQAISNVSTSTGKNTAIGYQAMGNATNNGHSIINSIGIGVNALSNYASAYYANDPSNNNAIGLSAMSNSTGSYNNAFGCSALSTTTGSYNVAIGENAGNAIAGSYNTFLGGNTTINGGTYSNSTAVGYGAAITGSNQIALGITGQTVSIPGTCNAASFNATSDRRIKTNIESIDPATSLTFIRLLQPSKYKYIDNPRKRGKYAYGFVAQEVESIIPEAIALTNDYIPNIYEQADVSGDIITLHNKSTSIFSADASGKDTSGNPICIKMSDASNNFKYGNIISIIDEKSFQLADPLDVSSIFVNGIMVHDFRSIDHSHIWTLTTSAVQELDSIIQRQQQQISELESKLTEQQQIQQEMSTQFVAIQNRLSGAGIP